MIQVINSPEGYIVSKHYRGADDSVIIEYKKENHFKKGDFLHSIYNDNMIIYDEPIDAHYVNSIYSNTYLDNKGWNIDCFRQATQIEKNTFIEYMHKKGFDWDSDNLKICKFVWKPKVGEEYFYINQYGYCVQSKNEGNKVDDLLFSIGNYFQTLDEARECAKVLSSTIVNLKNLNKLSNKMNIIDDI